VKRSVAVDTKKPLKNVLPQIARQLGIVEQFSLQFGQAEVDEDVTIEDLGPNPKLEIAIAQGAALVEVRLTVRGRLYQWQPKTVQFPPAMTLLALEENLRKDGILAANSAVDFTVTDPETGAVQTLVKAKTIEGLGLDGRELEVVSTSGISSPVQQVTSVRESTLQKQPGRQKERAAAKGLVGSEEVEYTFIVATDHVDEFHERFGLTQTVLDARLRIKERRNLADISDVTLIFAGKVLKDRFVLDRLRIGGDRIVVHMKHLEPMILYTIKSM
jgi:hypothetical protein